MRSSRSGRWTTRCTGRPALEPGGARADLHASALDALLLATTAITGNPYLGSLGLSFGVDRVRGAAAPADRTDGAPGRRCSRSSRSRGRARSWTTRRAASRTRCRTRCSRCCSRRVPSRPIARTCHAAWRSCRAHRDDAAGSARARGPACARLAGRAGGARCRGSRSGSGRWPPGRLFSIVYYGVPFPNTAYAKLATGIPSRSCCTRVSSTCSTRSIAIRSRCW